MFVSKNHKTEGQRGASMVEIMGVLAVIGMMAIGMLVGYQGLMTRFKTSQIVTHIQGLMKNMSTYFSSYRVYPTLTATQLYKLQFLTEEYYDDTGKVAIHPFGGNITFAAANAADGRSTYSFTYTNLPGAACVAVATMDIPVQNLLSIKIGNHTARAYPEPGEEGGYDVTKHLPFAASEAAKECDKNASNVTFTFQ